MCDKPIHLIQKLLFHEGFKRYGANTAWLMAERVLRMFVGLFVGIWIARYLGPEQFGLLSYAQSLVFLFTAIATLGLDSIVVRELVKDESKRDVLLGTAFTLKFIGALLILPLLWLGVQFTDNDAYTNLLVFIIASATIFQSFNVIDFYYQSTVMSKYVAFANSFSLLLSSSLKIILILNKAPLISFALMFVFDALILSLGLIYSYFNKTKLSLLDWRLDNKTAKQLLFDSFPLILTSIISSVYMRVDQVMINYFLDDVSVGYYAAAIKLSESWYFIPVLITGSLFPAIINAKINEELYYNRLQNLYTILIWFSISISIFVTFFSDFLIQVYGKNYTQASNILIIHIWTGVFVSFGVSKEKWLISENMQLYSLICITAGLLINIILNYFFIIEYGVLGSAVATLIAYIVATIGLSLFYSKDRVSIVMFLKSLKFTLK